MESWEVQRLATRNVRNSYASGARESQLWMKKNPDSNIYFTSQIVKKIVREGDSPLIEKFLVGTGEVVIKVENDRLDAYSIRYDGNNRVVTREFSHDLIQGYSPEIALENAKRGIRETITERELAKRRKQDQQNLRNYFSIHRPEQGRKISEQERALMSTTKEYIQKIAEDISQDSGIVAS